MAERDAIFNSKTILFVGSRKFRTTNFSVVSRSRLRTAAVPSPSIIAWPGDAEPRLDNNDIGTLGSISRRSTHTAGTSSCCTSTRRPNADPPRPHRGLAPPPPPSWDGRSSASHAGSQHGHRHHVSRGFRSAGKLSASHRLCGLHVLPGRSSGKSRAGQPFR